MFLDQIMQKYNAKAVGTKDRALCDPHKGNEVDSLKDSLKELAEVSEWRKEAITDAKDGKDFKKQKRQKQKHKKDDFSFG